jgi:hypothetical protein
VFIEVVALHASNNWMLDAINHEAHTEMKDDAIGINPSATPTDSIGVVDAFALTLDDHPFDGCIPVNGFFAVFKKVLLPEANSAGK